MTARLRTIYTTCVAPTAARRAKIRARASSYAGAADRTGLQLSIHHDAKSENPHRDAAQALARRLGWSGAWLEGEGPDGTGSVFVLMEDR